VIIDLDESDAIASLPLSVADRGDKSERIARDLISTANLTIKCQVRQMGEARIITDGGSEVLRTRL